jgi:hypothetical protein
MMKKLLNYLDDLLLLLGAACMVCGVAMLSVPAAWITAGILLAAFGILIGKYKAQHVTAKPADKHD